MLTLLVSAALALPNGPALSLDAMTVPDAVGLNGQVVLVTVTVKQPPDTSFGWTVAGIEVGGVERGVQMPGKWDVRQGDVITAVGVLKVVNTPGGVVNGQAVPACVSIVVVGARVR